MAMNFEPHKCVKFVQPMKTGTQENKTIHIILFMYCHLKLLFYALYKQGRIVDEWTDNPTLWTDGQDNPPLDQASCHIWFMT